jgi:uncharacterized protein (TIGR00288 family)
MAASPETTSMALFCDFENVALGVRDARYDRFDIKKVLERLLLKGSIVVKKAYCDWDRYREFKAQMHEANFELIEIPHVRQSGKNSADIRMVVDALDLCYTKAHVDTFVIISGDSDFSPLVSKLRENAKTVIGVGVKGSTSDLLTANCDEFIFYDDLVRAQEQRRRREKAAPRVAATAGNSKDAAAAKEAAKDASKESAKESAKDAPKESGRRRGSRKAAAPATDDAPAVPAASASTTSPQSAATPAAAALFHAPADGVTNGQDAGSVLPFDPGVDASIGEALADTASESDRRQEALELVVETVEALMTERGADDKIWGSMVKQTLKRRRPGFAEGYYGYRSFNDLLEDARKRNLLALERDEKSGGYVIRLI